MANQLQRWGKRFTATGMAVSLSLLTIACQEAADSDDPNANSFPGEAPTELKIGSLLPATGDLSALGAPMIASVPLLVDTVNACGGVNGAPVTLVSNVDDQTNEAAGTEGMKRLVSVDKVAGRCRLICQ